MTHYKLFFLADLTEEQEDYFLLCDVLPEDRVLREKLQQKRLVRRRETRSILSESCAAGSFF